MNRYVAAAFVVVLAATASAQPGPRRDGNWEVTVQMEMAGMPQAMPPMTLKQCITPEQAKDPSQLVPQQPGRGARRPRPLPVLRPNAAGRGMAPAVNPARMLAADASRVRPRAMRPGGSLAATSWLGTT